MYGPSEEDWLPLLMDVSTARIAAKLLPITKTFLDFHVSFYTDSTKSILRYVSLLDFTLKIS